MHHTWYCRRRDLLPVLQSLRPYLVTKAEEADAAIQILNSPTIDGETLANLFRIITAKKLRTRGYDRLLTP
jgi:hypothetical protein